MKKFLSILMACLILSFSFAGASFASEQETATVTVVEDTYTRMGNKAGLNFNGEYVGIASGLTAYLKFDISTLRTDMNGKDAKYTLQFTTTADKTNGTGSLIYIYGITGIEWKEDELTYNSANSTGLDTDITNKIGEISVVGKSATFTVDVTDYIKTVPTDTNIITIKLQNKETTGTVLLASKDTDPAVPATLTATRTYAEGTEAVFDEINIPAGATENITLPESGSIYGSKLIWSSSHPEVISADGTVTRQSGEVIVNLTATYEGYENIQKSFEVIVPKAGDETKKTADVTEDTHTRSEANQYVVQGNDMLVVDSSRTTYLKFNVTELKTAMNGKDAKYKLQFTSHNSENKAEGTVYVYGISGTNRTGWSDSSLTHNLALTNGLHEDTSNLLGEVYVLGKNATFTVDVTDYILSIPEDGIATLKIQNNVANAPVIVLQSSESAVSDAAKPKLIAERTYIDDYTGGINPKIYVNGKTATSLGEGVATARVAFVGNDVTDAPKGTLILALYNGEIFEEMKSVSLDFSDEFVNDMSVSLDVPSGEGYSVKAFLLSGFDTLVPLTECEELR